MKKVLFTLCLMSFVSVFAQVQIKSDHQKFKADELTASLAKKSILNLKRGTPYTFTFFPLSAGSTTGFIDGAGGTWKNYVGFLYPDSNAVVITNSNGKFNVSMHLVGNVFDPRDSNVYNYMAPRNNPDDPFTKFTKYSIDSMVVRFGYHRHLDSVLVGAVMTEVVDTMVFQYFNINQMTYSTYKQSGFESYAYPTKANFNLPSLRSSNASGTYKLPLTKADMTSDSGTGWVTNFYQVPVGVNVSPNGGVNSSFGYTMVYKPMVPAVLGDTVFDQTSNNASVVKKNNYVTYYYGSNEDVPANQVRQYSYTNNSVFTPKNIRYGQTANGWTMFIPGNAYFMHQNVYAYYIVTTSNLAVKNTSEDVKVMSVYPNPAKENSEVFLNLTSAKNTVAVVTLSDISGKVIRTINTDLTSGKNSINISTDSLSKGLYLVNVVGEGFTSSSKLVIE